MAKNKIPKKISTNSEADSWKSFRRLSINSKQFSKRLKSAETNSTKHAHKFLVGRIESIKASREQILAWFIVVAVVMSAIWGQMVLFDNASTVKADSVGGTYAEGVTGSVGSLNPMYASTSAEVAASRLMFSSLYNYDETGTLRRDLATSITSNPKVTEYTVKIRDDAKWHDGEALTAEDIVFTIETIKKPAVRVRSSLAVNWRDVNVELVDKQTVKFTLPAYAAFTHALTFPVIPKHLLAEVKPGALKENGFSSSPVGSGPFVFRILQKDTSVTRETVVHMLANESYYGGIAKVSRFELHAYVSSENLVKAIKNNALSAAADLSRNEVSELNSTDYLNSSYPVDNGVYALMNNSRGIFSDKQVRLAVQRILDVDQIRSSAGENVQPLDLPFIKDQVDSPNLPQPIKPSHQVAKQILNKAKWKFVNGKWMKGKVELKFDITTVQNDQYTKATDEVARQLKEFGIQATVKVIDDRQANSNFVGDILQRRNFEMLVYELPIGADPDVYAYWHSSQIGDNGYNFTSYKDKIADAALVSARDRTDKQLRNEKYALFARKWQQDAPAIGLYQQVANYIHKPNVDAVDDTAKFAIASDRYANVVNWTVSGQSVYKTP